MLYVSALVLYLFLHMFDAVLSLLSVNHVLQCKNGVSVNK